MADFFNTHITAILPIISSLLTLILGFIYNNFMENKRNKKEIEVQEKRNKQELKLKELEQKHKISEATYQKLFEKKIEVYNELHKLLLQNNEDILRI